jgi:N-methylhydantoinase A
MARLVAVDIGGTFTDLVALDSAGGAIEVVKVPTSPDDPSAGVREAVARAGIDLANIERFFHGTTLGINTVLEGKGGRTGLITTRGFRDVLEIGRMSWPMYRLHWDKPEPIIPRYLRFEVTERIRADGLVLAELREDEVREAAERLLEHGIESVAVSFINAYAFPQHEERTEEILKNAYPNLEVTLSHRLTREYREYERTATTTVDAMIRPRLSRYLGALEDGLRGDGLVAPLLITRSDGGVMNVEEARQRPVRTLLSGPASGVMGSAMLARTLELENVIAADMGGTSFDASLVLNGEPVVSSYVRIGHVPLLAPVVEMETIGAGGGSIAWIDPSGALNVGPKSAGADPGPICYGRGGTEPTFTDAAVASGLLDPAFFLGGEIPLDVDSARRGIAERVGSVLGLPTIDAASGIVALAEARMAATLEELTVGRGHDPRDFALVAYGGGGPLVAMALAARLEIPKVVIPRLPAAFSAYGMLMLDEVRDFARTRIAALNSLTVGDLGAEYRELERQAIEIFDGGRVPTERRRILRSIDMRYENQEHTLTIRLNTDASGGGGLDWLRGLFDAQHEATYGYSMTDPVEVVTYRIRAVATLEKSTPPPLMTRAANAIKGRRTAVHRESGGEREWVIHDRELLSSTAEVHGPAIIEEASATTLVLPGWMVRVDVVGNLIASAGEV